MPKWIPEKIWNNQDVFIIGGGKSLELERFDWTCLFNELTIGCNDAYKHGKKVCKICLFGDAIWFEHHKEHLEKFDGAVFTNETKLYGSKIPWLWTMQRESFGIHENYLAWNFNTGGAAVNLAVLLGAKRIFLLGFDMHLTNGRANWHENLLDKPDPEVYSKFQVGFKRIAKDLREKYPEIEVINVTNNSSLDLFPKVGVKEFWSKRQSF